MTSRNSNRPGYKHTKVGWIPEEWRCVSGLALSKMITVGIVIEPSKYYSPEGVKAFRSANVGVGRINDSSWVYLTAEGHSQNAKSILSEGDVLVVRSGAPGTACVVTMDYAGSNCIDLVIIRPNRSVVVPSYVCEFINSPLGKSQVIQRQGGLALKHFNVTECKQMLFSLPPFTEQKRIAKVLGAWDRAIALVDRLIEAKQRLKKGLMQKLLTGQLRFPQFGKPARKRDELPKGWAPLTFGEIFKRVNLKAFQIQRTDYRQEGLYPVVDQGKSIIVARTDSEPVRAPLPLVIFGDHTREIKWITFPFVPGADGTIALVAKGNSSIEYAYHALSSIDIVNLGYSRHFSELKNASFVVPPCPEQEKIASCLSACDREIQLLIQKRTRLQEQKKGLMQKLLTGEVRVKP